MMGAPQKYMTAHSKANIALVYRKINVLQSDFQKLRDYATK
jgi:hypothetical protein